MGLRIDRILRSKKVGFDTNLFIYALEGNTDFPEAIELFKKIPRTNTLFYASVLALLEVSVPLYKADKVSLIADYLNFVSVQKRIIVVDTNKDIALRAAELRAKYNLKTPNAIHLATAIVSGCKVFVTADRGFDKKINEIKVEII